MKYAKVGYLKMDKNSCRMISHRGGNEHANSKYMNNDTKQSYSLRKRMLYGIMQWIMPLHCKQTRNSYFRI
jgi:hypothetical protein